MSKPNPIAHNPVHHRSYRIIHKADQRHAQNTLRYGFRRQSMEYEQLATARAVVLSLVAVFVGVGVWVVLEVVK